MFAYSTGPRSVARRRGIVLVLILGMLGLMALIGVTFATFAGQSLRSGRNASQGAARPQAEALMDYALAQLINDTNNPLSAIRGHSLLRDMYGNDSVFRGSNPIANTAAEFGGILDRVQTVGGPISLQFTGYGPNTQTGGLHGVTTNTPFGNRIQYATNIPTTGQYYGLDFTRWIVRFPGGPNPSAYPNYSTAVANDGSPSQYATQTFEVLEDDATGSVHLFTLNAALNLPTLDPSFSNGSNVFYTSSDTRSFVYNDPNIGATYATTPKTYYKNYSTFTREINGTFIAGNSNPQSFNSPAFVLDGRYMRAFNGPGATTPVPSTDGNGNVINSYPYNRAAYANMRVAGFDPDSIGLDEDYDACDLENWFLALQSADGQVMIPSFHRPGILTAGDWTSSNNYQKAKILRPRVIDNSPLFPPDPSKPITSGQNAGQLTYDIDNDGDGVTDSVWLDLGYPVQRDPTGRLFKPLFAFMVLGLNGRLPLNTVGNLQARAIGTNDATIHKYYQLGNANTADVITFGSNGADQETEGSPSTITPGTVNYPNESGMVPYPGLYAGTYNQHHPLVTSQVFFDTPLYDHTSHLGYSVNEINPKFALQNAPSNLYPTASQSYSGVFTTYDATTFAMSENYAQYDNAGVPVALTQLRNILAGTRPTDAPYPFQASATNPLPPVGYLNNDANVVAVNGKAFVLPNNVADSFDYNPTNASGIIRNTTPVAGRWGEPAGIPQAIPFPADSSIASYVDPVFPMLTYVNFSRAGRSIYGTGSTIDSMDDDFDGMDPHLPLNLQQGTYSITATAPGTLFQSAAPNAVPLLTTGTYNGPNFTRSYPEDVDLFDSLSQRGNATERARLFVTPQDTAGTGRPVAFLPTSNTEQIRPTSEFDFGRGYDSRGRVGYFRYFRPAGLPQQVSYPYIDTGATNTYTTVDTVKKTATNTPGQSSFVVPYQANTGNGQRYLMPLLLPAGQAQANTQANKNATYGNRMPAPDTSNNSTHGLQAAMTPQVFTGTGTAQSLTPPAIAKFAATPIDFDPYFVATPPGYNDQVIDFNKSGSGSKTNGTKLMLFSPTINPTNNTLLTDVNTYYGPNVGALGDINNGAAATYVVPYGVTYTSSTPNDTGGNPIKQKDLTKGTNYNNDSTNNLVLDRPSLGAAVVNGYLGGGLNKDEADEMNPYTTSLFDQPYANADLEWLYRKHDVDGATLASRLGQLAPVSFLNDADGLTRRRLFSVDSWDLISFAYANDNPQPYAGTLGNLGLHSSDHDFSYNSRFAAGASPSLENMNQITAATTSTASPYLVSSPANAITTEFLPNPTVATSGGGTINGVNLPDPSTPANTTYTGATYNGAFTANYHTNGNVPLGWPLAIAMNSGSGGSTNNNASIFGNAHYNATAEPYTNLIFPAGTYSMVQTETPSVAHRDRRINLNYPLPVSHDPAEPIRQKWCRETYQFLKAILPPASVDTPEELAQLSQFVVNLVDFRDPDNAMTRFVNTDLVVTDVLTKQSTVGQFNNNSVAQPSLGGAFDTTWTVSPAGVRFADPNNRAATDSIPPGYFPFDPSLYSPDTDPNCRFLVQHGMEYCPIAINEAMAYSAKYGTSGSTTLSPYSGMFIELVNTLTEGQDNPSATYRLTDPTTGAVDTTRSTLIPNSSAVSVEGWDIVIAPDSCGWGRPDPISGDVNPIVVPTYTPNPGGSTTAFPADGAWVNNINAGDANWTALKNMTALFTIPPNGTAMNSSATPAPPVSNAYVKAMSGTNNYDKFIIGDYRASATAPTATSAGTAGQSVSDSTDLENTPVVTTTMTNNQIDVRLPTGMTGDATIPMRDFVLPGAPANQGMYYWVYLRRPANPFDIARPNQVRPNREMVVVDCIRMPVIDSSDPSTPTGTPPQMPANGQSKNIIYSASRLQPYRGGHLVAPNTDPTIPYGTALTAVPGTTGPAANVTKICPPSPAYAYGYSEQMQLPPKGSGYGAMKNVTGTNGQVTPTYQQTINDNNGSDGGQADSAWTHFPFFDRDFNNVAELLLVPCCPPGLFTKQFVEEPYPGNVINTASGNATAQGTDNGTNAFTYTTTPKGADTKDASGNVTTKQPAQKPNTGLKNGGGSTIVPPNGDANDDPTLAGRRDFNFTNPPAAPTFPYLSDNFYYTAASVGLPGTPGGVNASYTQLTTEIGGWTGAGWHKMLEFFEVPSSTNGAIGATVNGDNYDWYRADTKPGLLNLNLIIDDEVFAGLLDDPRLNETLAAYQLYNTMSGLVVAESFIPYVVTQIDANNLPVYDTTNNKYIGAYPMYSGTSTNGSLNAVPPGEIVPDTSGSYQLHASPLAGRGYSLRETNQFYNNTSTTKTPTLVHGLKAAFSDFLKLRSGGSGFLFAHGGGDVGMGDVLQLGSVTGLSAVAADRPYRSLSYPDINYTILRPASLPPSPVINSTTAASYTFFSPGTSPPLPFGLGSMYTYGADSQGGVPYVELVAGTVPGTTTANTPIPSNPSAGGTFNGVAPMNQATPYQYVQDPGIKNPFLPVQYVNTTTPTNSQPNVATGDAPLSKRRLAPPYEARVTVPATSTPVLPIAAPFPAPIPPTPSRRLFQIPDRGLGTSTGFIPSNAAIQPSYDSTQAVGQQYKVNQPVITPQLSTGTAAGSVASTGGFTNAQTPLMFVPPTLFLEMRSGFAPDNQTTQLPNTYYNYLGAGPIAGGGVTNDQRQHPLYRTELLQKISNLTTVRTHQFAVWITIGFFDVIKVGTPELGIPDILGAEFGSAGDRQRFRSFFVIDRTKATGFNPYYPGNFRDCVTYRRRIEG